MAIALIQYAAIAVTLAVCLYLFVTVKRDLRVMETRSMRQTESLRTQVRALAEELETVRRELERMEQRSGPGATLTRALGAGVRIQALRMIKDGEGSGDISAALGLPRNEVELLAKVQRLLSEPVPA